MIFGDFDASEIANWADLREAQHQLPKLIRLLVQETVKDPPSPLHMPSGSSVQLSGWDGLLFVECGNTWVPRGYSAWEFSCSQRPNRKATGEYSKRTAKPKVENIHATTFVFVTPRRWPGKWQWAKDRQQEGRWADVKALDADDLVAWLEQAPKVAAWFSALIRKSSPAPTGEHLDRLSRIEHKLSDVHYMVSSTTGQSVVQNDSAEQATLADPVHGAIVKEIDIARDLINRGFVSSALVDLERLRNEAGDIPEELEFRILTNLGACALAEEDFHRARVLLEEAHTLQPENPKGITNAALAASLAKNFERAIALALRARTLDARNSQATAVLMEVYFEANQDDLLEELVASEEWMARDKQCCLTLARIRMQQSRFNEAETLCRTLIDVDPDDALAQFTLSEFLLNRADSERVATGLTEKSLAGLREAEAAATVAIDLVQSTQLNAQRQRALVIRAVIRKFLGATSEAMADLDEVLRVSPAHPGAAFHKGLLLLYGGRTTEARTLFEGIQDSKRLEHALLPLSQACLLSGDANAAVELLKGTLRLECPTWDDVGKADVLSRAELSVGCQDSVGPELEVALELRADDPRLLTLAALLRERADDYEGAEKLLLAALEHSRESDRREILVQLGAVYQKLERFAEAADRFAEVVGGFASHPAAIHLLACLVNSRRLREALDLARRIRKTHPHPPRLAIDAELQLLEYVGDIRAAVSIHEEICSRVDANPVDRVNFASAQFRLGERDAALETVLAIRASELCHQSRSIMKLAQLKMVLEVEGYLDDAYIARRCGINDPAVHLGYLALFQTYDQDLVEPDNVAPGCAVLLKGRPGEKWWQILGEGEEPFSHHEQKPSQDLAQQLLGRRVGETVVLREGLEDLSYEIKALQSKYVRAYQETCDEFSTRFPGNMELSRIAVDDNDLSNIFLLTDKRDEFVRNVNLLYQQGRLPFLTLSTLIGRSGLEVWRQCTYGGPTRIRFATGAKEEATHAGDILRGSDGVVLDLVAIMTMHELGIAEQLRNRFSRVAVPQSVIDEIRKGADTIRSTGPVSGYLGKTDDGRYAVTEISEKDRRQWREFVCSVLEFAESFERVASYSLLDADQAEKIVDALTDAGAGAVYAGDEQVATSLVLVSDDLGISYYARSLSRDTVNTQAVLQELHRTNEISADAYSSYVEQLALLNYWFLRITAKDIIRRLEASGYITTEGTRAMLGTLEGPDCSEDSAVSVGTELITATARKAPPEQTDVLLEVVIAMLRRGATNRSGSVEIQR